MESHDPKKMYYWYLQQREEQKNKSDIKRICQKCGRVVPPFETMMINICRKCYDENMEKIAENMKKHRRK